MLAAWVVFLSLTAIVFFLAFRSIFPSPTRYAAEQHLVKEETVTMMMRNLESMIARGFEAKAKDPLAQKKTFEALRRILARKVTRKYEMNETEQKALMENPSRLVATLGDALLVQLLSAKLKPNVRSWNLAKLSDLISKVEDWGR